MWHVINTRPAERAAALTHALQQAGHQVSELPLLALQPCSFDEELKQQLQHIRQVQTVVVVSPTAAKLGLQHLRELHISPSQLSARWIAVGQGTAKLLQQAGIQAQVPDVETSEGMLQLDIFNPLRQVGQKTLMLWRGFGGRRFMFDQLQQQGWQLFDVNLYRRQLPKQSQIDMAAVVGQSPDVLLISSGQSWQHWQQLTASKPFYPTYILVLGQRVRDQIARDLAGHAAVQLLLMDDLQPDHVLAVLQRLEKCQEM